MRILVIDDSKTHRDAAVAQLGNDHEVVTASDSNEGLKLLGSGYGHGEDKSNVHQFDVVLCDLLMPSPGRACYSEDMDAGIYLAITAARNGAKYVGLLTDSNHHEHPAADCLDSIERDESWPDVFSIDGALVCLANTRNWIEHFSPANLAKPLEFNEWYQKPEVQTVTAKNWWYLLNRILKEVEDRPMDAESISAVIADRKRLQAEVSKAQAEIKKLQAENEKLQGQAKQDGQKLSLFSSAVQSLRAATQLGWLGRRRTLPGIIKKLVDLIQPETK